MKINIIKYQLAVSYQFFRRDLLVYKKEAWKVVTINYALIAPVVMVTCFGYLVPHLSMAHPTPLVTTNFITGGSLWTMFLLAWSINFGILFDLHSNRFIDYQMGLIKPQLLLLEKIFFSAFIAFINFIPFYPITKLILGANFLTVNTSWPKLFVIFASGSLFCASFTMFFVFFIKSMAQTGNLFMRMNYPLIQFGGTFIPWSIMNSISPWVGTISYLNPMLYITEGFRQTIIGGNQYFAFSTCVLALLGFSVLFTLITLHYFKKKLDHI